MPELRDDCATECRVDMLARMSGKAKPSHQAKSAHDFGDALRREFPLLIGLGTAAIFLQLEISSSNSLGTRSR